MISTVIDMTALLDTPSPVPTRRRRRIVIFASATLFLILLLASVPTMAGLLRSPADGEPVVGVNDITIRNERFDPPVIQVTAETTVVWTFDDGGTAHNVVADDWSSETLTSGTFEHTFTEAGSYSYRCTLHWGMEGRVEVVGAR
jgi:plastocyanin